MKWYELFRENLIVISEWRYSFHLLETNNLERQIQTVVFELGDIKLKLIIPVKVVNKSVGFFFRIVTICI